jgi:prepilin-type N-terminal cleavage/methylation domain-containing protein
MPRAFTLVELLVVIAIVAVLAGLALAALPGLLNAQSGPMPWPKSAPWDRQC